MEARLRTKMEERNEPLASTIEPARASTIEPARAPTTEPKHKKQGSR